MHIVTNANAKGVGSLDEAVRLANADTSGPVQIGFSLAPNSTIVLANPLFLQQDMVISTSTTTNVVTGATGATNLAIFNPSYDGDELPFEATRAFYFNQEATLLYSIIADPHDTPQPYFLHPIAVDRFCLGFSLLENVAPDLYKAFYQLLPPAFNDYQPKTLAFWQPQAHCIRYIQHVLCQEALKMKNLQQRWIVEQIVSFIDVNPLKRTLLPLGSHAR